MTIGETIKKERVEHDLTQEELAKKMNISRQTVSKWEVGTSLPNIEQLTQLAELFNLSLDNLIKGDKKVEKKVIKDSKREFLWWEDDRARPLMLLIWGGIMPVLYICKYVLHLF